MTLVRAARGVIAGTIGLWLLESGLGLAAATYHRGSGRDAFQRVTPFDAPHGLLGHLLLLIVAGAILLAGAHAVGQPPSSRGGCRPAVQTVLSLGAVLLAALSIFTGYLARPPLTEGSLLRFVMLHIVLCPFLGLLSLIGLHAVTGYYSR